jgi:hypothetical protein
VIYLGKFFIQQRIVIFSHFSLVTNEEQSFLKPQILISFYFLSLLDHLSIKSFALVQYRGYLIVKHELLTLVKVLQTLGQSYQTFYGLSLRIFTIS